MKVNVTKESKRQITMAQEKALKKLIAYYKENDDSTPTDYARMAARHIFYAYTKRDRNPSILLATARVERNASAYGWIDDTDDLDVLITFTACDYDEVEYCDHILIASCCVSDICRMDDHPTKDQVLQKYTYRLFTEIPAGTYRD